MSQLAKKQDGLRTYRAEMFQKTDFISKKSFVFTSVLYVVAAIFQLPWIYILFKNFDQVKRWMNIPIMGWAMAIVFIGMVIAIPFLFLIGIKLFLLIRKASQISSGPDEQRKRKNVNMLLIIGIVADIFFSSLLIFSTIKDRSVIPFAVALFAGKILQANFEAIALYFDVKKK